jgi:hypothetical protein
MTNHLVRCPRKCALVKEEEKQASYEAGLRNGEHSKLVKMTEQHGEQLQRIEEQAKHIEELQQEQAKHNEERHQEQTKHNKELQERTNRIEGYVEEIASMQRIFTGVVIAAIQHEIDQFIEELQRATDRQMFIASKQSMIQAIYGKEMYPLPLFYIDTVKKANQHEVVLALTEQKERAKKYIEQS